MKWSKLEEKKKKKLHLKRVKTAIKESNCYGEVESFFCIIVLMYFWAENDNFIRL